MVLAKELLDARLLKKLKKSKYDGDKLLYKLVNVVDNKSFFLTKIKLQPELIMLRKEKLIVLPHIVFMVLLNFFMLM